jgi:Arc/MetJ-type ribon-helix-helix transcriptional regulator
MSEEAVKVRLNQQQLELVDHTVERGEASDREALFRRALREFWQAQSEASTKDRR